MQNALYRQESKNIAVVTCTVFLSLFLTTFSITWLISYPEDRSNILYRIARCHISEHNLEVTESSVRANIRFEKEFFLTDPEPKCFSEI